MSKKSLSNLRKRFKPGEKVVVDQGRPNGGYEATVVSQTPGKLFTVIKRGDDQWTVMSDRLTKLNQ